MKLYITKQCRLEGPIPKHIADNIKSQLTLDNPKYLEAIKFGRWIGKGVPAKLEFYRETGNSLVFPRGYSSEILSLLEGIPTDIRTRKLPEIDFQFNRELRDYQKEAIPLLSTFGVIEAGTGSGKTIMALAIIAKRKQPTLILVHNKELLYQWQERIKTFLGINCGLIGDGNKIIKPITVAIVNTAKNMIQTIKPLFGHLIVDECHRVPASLFTETVKEMDCVYMLGLSATPYRGDGLTKLIHIFIGPTFYKVSQELLENEGAVIRPRVIQKETKFYISYRGDYKGLIQCMVKNQDRNNIIVQDVISEIKKGTALVVSDRVEHCQVLSSMLYSYGVKTALLTGGTKAEERKFIIKLIKEGKIQVLISTVQLIGEGFDCPGLTSLFLATPIKYIGRIIQVVGRIMRPTLDKKDPVVYDYIDNIASLRANSKVRLKILLGEKEF